MVLSSLLEGSDGMTSLTSLVKDVFVVWPLRLSLDFCPMTASAFKAV